MSIDQTRVSAGDLMAFTRAADLGELAFVEAYGASLSDWEADLSAGLPRLSEWSCFVTFQGVLWEEAISIWVGHRAPPLWPDPGTEEFARYGRIIAPRLHDRSRLVRIISRRIVRLGGGKSVSHVTTFSRAPAKHSPPALPHFVTS